MEAELLAPADKAEIEQQTSALVEYANALVVDSEVKYTEAAHFSVECARTVKGIKERLDPICEATDKAHKAATKLRGDLLAVPMMARSLVDQKVTAWHHQQAELRAAAERKLREEQQKKADEERLALAEKAEAIGDVETRDVLLDKLGAPSPRPLSAPVDVPKPPKVQGFAVGTSYGSRLKPDGLKELVAAASKNDALLCYLMADMGALNRSARAQREAFAVPGVELVTSGVTRVRA